MFVFKFHLPCKRKCPLSTYHFICNSEYKPCPFQEFLCHPYYLNRKCVAETFSSWLSVPASCGVLVQPRWLNFTVLTSSLILNVPRIPLIICFDDCFVIQTRVLISIFSTNFLSLEWISFTDSSSIGCPSYILVHRLLPLN